MKIEVLLMLGMVGGQGAAQILHATGPRPAFQVATIKPSSATETRAGMGFSAGGRGFTTVNATLRDLIQEAYNVKSAGQIEGASGWMTSDKFDIEARMDDPQVEAMAKLPMEKKIDQVRLMLQSLLEERFALKLGESTRQATFFDLVVAKGGSKMKATEMAPIDPAGAPAHPVNGPRLLRRGPGKLEATGASMGLLTDTLSRLHELGAEGGFTVGELIVDKTGLTGMYDWTLNWTPDTVAQGDDVGDAAGPSLFTALQEQLGLKLEKTKAPVEVLVIEHVERPTEN